MLQNAYFLAKIGADTAENEQHFAEILPTVDWLQAQEHGGEHFLTPGPPSGSRRRGAASPGWRGPGLKGSIGEGPNHSNFSDQSSVKIVPEQEILLGFIGNPKNSGFRNICQEQSAKFRQNFIKI